MHRLAWAVFCLGCMGIYFVRQRGPQLDFAVTNVMTFLLLVFMWLTAVVALQTSALPRWLWRSLLLLPILGVVALFSMFRIERIDGELLPQFRSRWAPAAKLPSVARAENMAVAIEKLQPRETDFAQFLGPQRNGVIDDFEIDDDWATHPPQVAWKINIGDGWSSFAVQGDVAVTMEQRDEQEWVSAYDVSDGELLWSYAMDSKHSNPMGGAGPRSTPLIHADRVYAASAVSRVVCLDLASGREIWSQELLELAQSSQPDFEKLVAWGRSGSPLLWNSQLILPLGGTLNINSLIAFDAMSGDELWRAGDEQISYSSPTIMRIDGIEQLLIVTESTLRSFDPRDQRELWQVDWPGSSNASANVSQPVQVDEQHLLMTKGYGLGCQLIEVRRQDDVWSPRVLWKNEASLRTKFTSAVCHDGFAYGLNDGILECVDLSNGKRKWKKGRYKQGQLLLVGSKLLISSEAGQLILVATDPNEFRELASMPVIGDVTWNTPALSGNRLLIRNSDEAACVLLPAIETSPSLPADTEQADTEQADTEQVTGEQADAE